MVNHSTDMKTKCFLLFFLSLTYPIAYGKVCLPLDWQLTELNDIQNFDKVQIDPSGSRFLYEDKTSAIILFDLETKNKTTFLSSEENLGPALDEVYGFSINGSLIWTVLKQNFIKVKNFIKNKTVTLPIIPKNDIPTVFRMSEDRSTFFIMSSPENTIKEAEKFDKEIKQTKMSQAEQIYFTKKMWDKWMFNFHILDMDLLHFATHTLKYSFNLKCATLRNDSSVVWHDSDGSAYIKSFKKSNTQSLKIFDPIEGIQIGTYTNHIFFNGPPPNCLFVDENTIIIKHAKKSQYILRLIKEQKEFTLTHENLFGSDGQIDQMNMIQLMDGFKVYPFHIYHPKRDKIRVYHIPSGQLKKIKGHYFTHISKKGQLAIDRIDKHEQENPLIQLIHHPFDFSKRKVLLEWDGRELEHISFNENRSLIFIGTVFGDLFVVDADTGNINRHSFGQRFRKVKISNSGSTFLLEHLEGRRAYWTAHRVRQLCVEPEVSPPRDMERQLVQFAAMDDPADPSLLAFLTGVLKDEKVVNKYSKLIQPILWNVFLHYPSLYLNLHSHYPSLKFIPSFTTSLIKDIEVQSKAQQALQSVFELQTRLRYTSLSHWDFIHILKPILHILPDNDKNFYMERITESISNGATMANPLLQEVFQSKLFYVIYSYVKTWFGENYQPMSDITVVREKQSFKTVILSSEPIQNYPSIATDFGIHYAVVAPASYDLLPEKINEGMEIFNDFIKWRLANGDLYRAHLKVNVQDHYKRQFVRKTAGPDYKSVWKDQKMTGVIVIGSSLRYFSENLLKNYRSYFEGQGFQFSYMETKDFKSFFQERVAKCEIDYFLRESHSGGDEQNVFRFDLVNSIFKGSRHVKEGQMEVVYLVLPKPFYLKKRPTGVLSNLELAQAINEREQNGCGEITYFNTSCWAHVKARYEIESINSPLFLNIPSTSMSDTFLNQEGDAIRSLIHSYRNGLNFNGFRESLENNKGYKFGKINKYIFPDEDQYNKSIFQPIAIPLKIRIDLERKEGEVWKPVSPI